MAYKVEYKKQAASFLKKQPAKQRKLVVDAIEELAEDPDSKKHDVKSMVKISAYRLRVGKYRVIYEKHKDRLVIIVFRIRTRGNVYKGS
jgi:mRNA interferase RelE/StbE